MTAAENKPWRGLEGSATLAALGPLGGSSTPYAKNYYTSEYQRARGPPGDKWASSSCTISEEERYAGVHRSNKVIAGMFSIAILVVALAR
jgi:hypothetical protein